jgi:hypothetical protein
MSPSLSELLKLPASERAELAMALWESLSEAEREGELRAALDETIERIAGNDIIVLAVHGRQHSRCPRVSRLRRRRRT